MRPVVELMFMDFVLVAADQIVNQAAKLRYMSGGQAAVPIVIRAQQGGGRGNGAQHSQSFEAWLAQVPGLKVVAPATPDEGLLKSAIRDGNRWSSSNWLFIQGRSAGGQYHPHQQARSSVQGVILPSSRYRAHSCLPSKLPKLWRRRASRLR
jgi:hypothetical protein